MSHEGNLCCAPTFSVCKDNESGRVFTYPSSLPAPRDLCCVYLTPSFFHVLISQDAA